MRRRPIRHFFAFLLVVVVFLSQVCIGTGQIATTSTLDSTNSKPTLNASIATSDPDFSIVLFPDTQYYNGSYNYVFQDQANWVVANKAALNVKLVIGLGDIVDGGGYPVDSAGKVVGTCRTTPPSSWQKQWQQAQAAIKILTSNGIPYQPTIGNHDYDCQADRPQPRSATNYFYYFGPPAFQPTGYILDSAGKRTPNFYQKIKMGSTTYMILSLELFPQSSILAKANQLISSFSGPVIVVTHAYLSNDGSGPTFGSTFPAGSAYPLCSGFPGSVYGCLNDSIASYSPVGGGTDGIGLWYKLVGIHSNIFMALSGHVRNPNPGNYPNVPSYNGVGYVDCGVQSWTTLCSNPSRPIQMLSDFQGQGNGGYFGYGYLRILTVSPKNKKVSVFTYSPSIAQQPSKFPSGIPAYKKDVHNQFTVNFPNTFGGPNAEITQITTPLDGTHVSSKFSIAAAASGPDNASHMQIYVDGAQYADFPGVSSLPQGTQITIGNSGTHRVSVQTYNNTKKVWVRSTIYVTVP
jgi:hypothetical protein